MGVVALHPARTRPVVAAPVPAPPPYDWDRDGAFPARPPRDRAAGSRLAAVLIVAGTAIVTGVVAGGIAAWLAGGLPG